MSANPVLAEVWRGSILECVHRGTAVVCRPDGSVEAAWGDPARVVLPRSSCKMVQALPLVESGAADDAGLSERHLALACASHQGAVIHTELAQEWLAGLGLGETDLRCGPQIPDDPDARHDLRAAKASPCQFHNNCSGKHSGMLTLNRRLMGSPEYIDPDHPVQQAIKAATQECAGEDVSGYAIDGCSAPNFAISLRGLATSMARFARPEVAFNDTRSSAATRLRDAMMAHPLLVAGNGRACSILMEACAGRAAVKTGADGVFIAILPDAGVGIAVKIDDGATRGSHAAITALLARYGALERSHPAYGSFADAPIHNRRNIECGRVQAVEILRGP